MFLELKRPFSYLSIRHPDGGVWIINWGIPIVISTFFVIITYRFGVIVDLFGASGVIGKILGFVQNLPGFFIAALAAVATFNSPSIDKKMPGIPPQIDVLYNGKLTTVDMTRRRFLCVMFAYLTIESFLITVGSIFLTTYAAPLKELIPVALQVPVKTTVIFFYIVFFAQMLCVTLWGLFYLGERLHTPD
jgi:hypothetical protein